MPSATLCPSCGRPLDLPDALRGRPVKCPACLLVFAAPAPTVPVLELDAPADPDRVPVPRRGVPEPERPWRPPPRLTGDDETPGERRAADGGPPPRRDQEPHRGQTVLTLGVCGLAGVILAPVGLILSITAWAMGANDLRRMRAGEMGPGGEGATQGGVVCGIIGTVLNVLACAVWLFLLVLTIEGGTSPTSAPRPMRPGRRDDVPNRDWGPKDVPDKAVDGPPKDAP
jgi:hypothetical protein